MTKRIYERLLKIYTTTLLAVSGLIVLHAPLSVWLGTSFGNELLIKSWKEIILILLIPLAIVLVWQKKEVLNKLKSDGLIILTVSYALLHILLFLILKPDILSGLAGLAIDLRYLLFFMLVYIAAILKADFIKDAVRVAIVSAGAVVLFGLLQVTVLPKDALSAIGYGPETIQPYLTIDKNEDYIRINSTLRGPNPLGAYLVIVLAGLLALVLKMRKSGNQIIAASFGLIALVSLYFSHSRSAWAAAVLSLGLVLVIKFWKKLDLKKWLLIGAGILVIMVAGLFIKNTDFYAHVIEHRDPKDTVQANSNEAHIESLQDGVRRVIEQPLGEGPGSTGSASLLSDTPLIIENQYLFIAHETGWLGLGLFAAITFEVLRRLWHKRSNWLALGVLASGISLSLVGLLQPVWVDDTVSLIWWGLAAVVLGNVLSSKQNGQNKNKTAAK